MPQLDRKTEILLRQKADVPSIVIAQRFGERDVLFEYDYEYECRLAPEYKYGVVDARRVRVLKTDSKTHDDRRSML